MKTDVSIFKNYSKWVENKNLKDIINDIQSGKQKAEIETIRSLITAGQNDNAAALKNKLPAFTVSGNFENGRKAADIVSYSNFLVLDLDKLSAEQVENVQKLVKLAHYTYASFISPSGNGMKIIVQVNSSVDHHKEAFKQVADHYKNALILKSIPQAAMSPDCVLCPMIPIAISIKMPMFLMLLSLTRLYRYCPMKTSRLQRNLPLSDPLTPFSILVSSLPTTN